MRSDTEKIIRKKRGRKIAIVVILLLLAAAAFGVWAVKRGGIGPYAGTVTVEIRCDGLAKDPSILKSEELAMQIPSNGVILKKTTVRYRKDETVLDALERVCDDEEILYEVTKGSETTKYVRGIANLYEKDAGKKSGWVYTVNGKSPNVGANACKLNDGDRILWYYTIDYETDTAGE